MGSDAVAFALAHAATLACKKLSHQPVVYNSAPWFPCQGEYSTGTTAPLIAFLKQHPSINLEIVIEPSLIDIVAQRFDARVLYEEHLAHDMIALSLGPFRTLRGRPYYGALI
jgi:hypothetical protein